MRFLWTKLPEPHPGLKAGELHAIIGAGMTRSIGAKWGFEMSPPRKKHRDEDDKLAQKLWNRLFPTSNLDRPSEDFEQTLMNTLAQEISNEIDNEIINSLRMPNRQSGKASRSRR